MATRKRYFSEALPVPGNFKQEMSKEVDDKSSDKRRFVAFGPWSLTELDGVKSMTIVF
jgi:hypothetical protein